MTTTGAAAAVEPVLDAAEEAILDGVDGIVGTLEVFRTNPVALAAAGIVGVVAGGVGGYFIARKKLRSFYEDLATQEIAEAKVFYQGLNKTDEDGAVLTPQEVLAQRHGPEAAAAALRTYQGNGPFESEEDLIAAAAAEQGEPHDEEVDERQIQKITERAQFQSISIGEEPSPHGGKITVVEETTNIFAEPLFDLEEETKFRTEDKPYIISHDEFFAADLEYENVSLTYFETDDTLVDERDQPIDNTDEMVGDDHLVRFGHGSKDRKVVYVRNDRLNIDFEITKSNGSYLEDVLGLEAPESSSLKHSDQRDRRRAFRHGED